MTTGDSSLELQKAVYDALKGDAQLTILVGTKVYDSVPAGTGFPYVAIGDDTAVPFDSDTFDGMEMTLTIHSWARGLGRKEVKTIMGNVYRILHKSTLNMNGHTMVLMRFEFAETDLDPDGVTYHGVQRFRALTQGV